MTKNAIFWIRDDFRIHENPALSFASNNHNSYQLFCYSKSIFDGKESSKWWISKSLEEFEKDLGKYNIPLEIVESE